MSEYLNTDEWRTYRKAAIELAGGRCQLCNSDEGICVHHRAYSEEHVSGCAEQSDLVVLCKKCHFWFHESQRKGHLSGDNKRAKWKKTKADPVMISSGLEARLERLVEKHINLNKLSPRQYKARVEVIKKAMLLGII